MQSSHFNIKYCPEGIQKSVPSQSPLKQVRSRLYVTNKTIVRNGHPTVVTKIVMPGHRAYSGEEGREKLFNAMVNLGHHRLFAKMLAYTHAILGKTFEESYNYATLYFKCAVQRKKNVFCRVFAVCALNNYLSLEKAEHIASKILLGVETLEKELSSSIRMDQFRQLTKEALDKEFPVNELEESAMLYKRLESFHFFSNNN